MNKRVVALVLGISILAGLATGYYFKGVSPRILGSGQQKPAVNTSNVEVRVDAETPVILEKEYLRSHKVIISEFENRFDIIGFTLDEVRSRYSAENGFFIKFADGSLVIRQTIDDWTPEDKVKCRLKEYQSMVAIYIGPDAEHDTLMKVTAIRSAGLPVNIREAIQKGEYEFQNEAEVNDALENLDEYL
ncbi:MAG: hypothetical protein ABRQ24_01230 [Syntrophomonadaceae bacterium]